MKQHFFFLGIVLMAIVLTTSCKSPLDVENISLSRDTIVLTINEEFVLTATITPNNATDNSVEWSSSNSNIAKVNKGVVTALSLGETTIIAKAGNKTDICIVKVRDGAKINGVIWATCNVDDFGTFAPTPESANMLYQWNRPTAWNNTDENVEGWDNSIPEGTKWAAANDPSPDGWRIPTMSEIASLLDTRKVKQEFITQNEVRGVKFTDIDTKCSIFLPATGYRLNDGFLIPAYDGYGYYWSSTGDNSSTACCLMFFNGYIDLSSGMQKIVGASIRCVAE